MNLCSRLTFLSPVWDGLSQKVMVMFGRLTPRSGVRPRAVAICSADSPNFDRSNSAFLEKATITLEISESAQRLTAAFKPVLFPRSHLLQRFELHWQRATFTSVPIMLVST